MYENLGNEAGMQRRTFNPQPDPFGNAFYGAGSELIRGGLGAYGEKFLGSSSEFMQSNISRYFSNPQYYFQVNDQYVRNKLKVVLLPFLHRFFRGLVGWVLQDIVAYGGYAFADISLAILAGLVFSYSYCFLMPWTCMCMGVFLVKTMKRVLFTEMRSYEKNSNRHESQGRIQGMARLGAIAQLRFEEFLVSPAQPSPAALPAQPSPQPSPQPL